MMNYVQQERITKTFVLMTVSAAALLSNGTASAQTYPYSDPNFYTNTTSQSNSTVAASVDQRGDNNTASTSQDLSGTTNQNTSVIVQGFNLTNANQSHATVSQTGSGQRSLILQTNTNTATTGQSGANNDAFAYQTGTGNTANIAQSGTSNPSHTGTIGGVNGVGSTSGGKALADSFANQNETQIEGTVFNGINLAPGDDLLGTSAAYVVQASGAINNGAAVNQSGAGERAVIAQINFEANSTAGVVKSASGSDASIHQDGGSFNNGGVTQSGTFQSAAIYQTSSTSGIASVNQSGSGQIGFAVQTGTANQSYITQSNTNNQAKSQQSGNNDQSYITQSGKLGIGTVTQVGGTNNTSYLTQTADNDAADVTQTGSYNFSSVGQTISSAWAHVGQNGTGNSSTISQGH